MDETNLDRPNTIHWPPILYGAVILIAWVLERLVPLQLIGESLLLRWFGGLILLLGAWLALAALFRFHEIGTPFDPTGQATALATEGVYAYTRNPMYVGALICFFGLGLALRSSWLLILVPPLGIALLKLAIEREEAYLKRRFGAAYDAYAARVRRWL